jgi:hypothetical protein
VTRAHRRASSSIRAGDVLVGLFLRGFLLIEREEIDRIDI